MTPAKGDDPRGLMGMVAKNPQILSAVAGLGGLVSAFQSKGLGDMVSSWISTGPNPPISA